MPISRHGLQRFHPMRKDTPSKPAAPDIMRRFFSLIERFERPRPSETAAPEVKARITRFDAGERKAAP